MPLSDQGFEEHAPRQKPPEPADPNWTAIYGLANAIIADGAPGLTTPRREALARSIATKVFLSVVKPLIDRRDK